MLTSWNTSAKLPRSNTSAVGIAVTFGIHRSTIPKESLVTSHRYGGKKITIYVTRTGQKYHRDGCRYVARSRIPMSLKEATKRFGPCSFALAAEVAGKTTTTERPDRNRYPDERRNCASNHSESERRDEVVTTRFTTRRARPRSR